MSGRTDQDREHVKAADTDVDRTRRSGDVLGTVRVAGADSLHCVESHQPGAGRNSPAHESHFTEGVVNMTALLTPALFVLLLSPLWVICYNLRRPPQSEITVTAPWNWL